MKKFILFFFILISNCYSYDSLYVSSVTYTNLDSLNSIRYENVEWDSITTSTNYFVGENDSWYLLQVIGKESSGSKLINKLKGE
jgi:predicted porin